jgi:hypothetical protein
MAIQRLTMSPFHIHTRRFLLWWLAICFTQIGKSKNHQITLPVHQYQDRVEAVWTAQMLGAIMGFPFEHKVAFRQWIDQLNPKIRIPESGYISVCWFPGGHPEPRIGKI